MATLCLVGALTLNKKEIIIFKPLSFLSQNTTELLLKWQF